MGVDEGGGKEKEGEGGRGLAREKGRDSLARKLWSLTPLGKRNNYFPALFCLFCCFNHELT